MNIALSFWLRKRNKDKWVRLHAVSDTRRQLRAQYAANPKGKGNKAWKRVEALDNQPGTLVWPDYAF